jgi:hypothetical protein
MAMVWNILHYQLQSWLSLDVANEVSFFISGIHNVSLTLNALAELNISAMCLSFIWNSRFNTLNLRVRSMRNAKSSSQSVLVSCISLSFLVSKNAWIQGISFMNPKTASSILSKWISLCSIKSEYPGMMPFRKTLKAYALSLQNKLSLLF